MSSRSGAALIIAIVVLAAMLLLGLPFLFTQSSSLSGTRSYAHGRLASMGQDSAQSMGVAAGSIAMSYRWQQNGVNTPSLVMDDWTSLFYGLGGDIDNSGLIRVGVNRVEFDTRNNNFAFPGGTFIETENLSEADRELMRQRYPTVVGLAIEDESGKLDPNHMETQAWFRLLQAVGINDWTDGQIPVLDQGRFQLSRALAGLRHTLPGGRITSLDQLLQADPPATIAGTNLQVPNPRRGLTRAELERLRPYLTVSVPAPARGGLIDLGTVIGVDGQAVTLDHDTPASMLAFAPTPVLMGGGTTLVVTRADGETFTMPALGETTQLPPVKAAVALSAPPVVNLHQAEQTVRRVLAPQAANGSSNEIPPALQPAKRTEPPLPALLTGLGTYTPTYSVRDALGHPLTTFDLVSPLPAFDRQGMTHVTATIQGDAGATGPFDASLRSFDIAGIPVLDQTATTLRVRSGSLDRFPSRGFALLEGKLADTDASAIEIIEYRRSVPPLPLSPADAAGQREVLLLDVRRGLDGVTKRATSEAKRFRAGLTTNYTPTNPADKQGDLHLTILLPREQQPLGIASAGVITIASTATVTDPAGNQTAQDRHRVIAQALPQENVLEQRYDKQVTFHATLAQRHGSLVTTFPNAYPRLSDVRLQDAANVDAGNSYKPPVDTDEPEDSVGVSPAPMHTLLNLPHVARDWLLPFAGTSSTALHVTSSTGDVQYPPVTRGSGPYKAIDITPTGLRLDDERVLAYPNPSEGFLKDAYDQTNHRLAPIQGRQFALWVRPKDDWDQQIQLLDMKLHSGNVGERLTGESVPKNPRDKRMNSSADAAISNRFSLIYDPVVDQLVLILNPGTIPHFADYGPPIPRQTYGQTPGIPIKNDVWPAVNPECLGRGGTYPDAPMWVETQPMASAQPELVIQHRYHVGGRFKPGEWHLIQVAFSSNQPGGMSIIVDGLVGRDVTRMPDDATAMEIPGDHLTQPVLVLADDLDANEQVKDHGTVKLYEPKIRLRALAFDSGAMIPRLTGADAVRRLLPERGLVRIGSEYISYRWIDDTGALRDCVRGRRQRTHGGVDNKGVPTWGESHVKEPHWAGDAVYPGGFAFTVQQNVKWYRGGCHLAQPMPDGDPTHRYQVWAKVAVETLEATSTAIPLTGGVIGQFPPRGYVLIGNEQVYYDKVGKLPEVNNLPALLNIHYWSDGTPGTEAGWISGLPRSYTSTATSPTEVVLISQEIAGKNAAGVDIDPTKDDRYSNDPSSPNEKLIQLYDARSDSSDNAGRAEWISYSEIRSRSDYPGANGQLVSYLINLSLETTAIVADPDPMQPPVHLKTLRGGFWYADGRTAPFIRHGARAQHRTGFAAADFSDYTTERYTFPELTTRVIPVQTNLEIAYLLEAGDVVTLAPVVSGGGQRPIQLCVRFSADDGFPETKGDPSATAWNAMNKYFAFTEAIPGDWNKDNAAFHLLSWPCWTPEVDLSDLRTDSEWRRDRLGWVLPWGNAYAPDFTPQPNGQDRVLTFLTTSAGTGVAASIDAVHAGKQPGWDQGKQVQANVVSAVTNKWLDDQPLTARRAIRTDQAVFTLDYGLVEIGGEVFAYDRQLDRDLSNRPPGDPQRETVAGNDAWLIGRSLLGSVARVHRGPELVLHLPIGPVAEIMDGLAINRMGRVQYSGSFSAPAMLLTSRNGDAMELTTMPNSHTAPWLRGMYNTTAIDWTARGSNPEAPNLAPLAIGWWPRYPSGYPQTITSDYKNAQDLRKKEQTQPLTQGETYFLANHGALMRSRSFAWAGFPLRFHNCRFPLKAVPPGKTLPEKTVLASIQMLSTGNGIFDLNAYALDASVDWTFAGMEPLPIKADGSVPVDPVDVTNVFNSSRFVTTIGEAISKRLFYSAATPRVVDGAEVRVTWSYRAPRLTSSTEPAKWLQQAAKNGNNAPMIGPVRLRTYAPNQVLNVER
jgi:hypothetical protein